VTINNTNVTAGSVIILTWEDPDNAFVETPTVVSRTAGTSFDINIVGPTDANDAINYIIINP
jgi:hypothetical protein